jgi:Arc/MetJ-type ribon-helix-helix transcriptional regulator
MTINLPKDVESSINAEVLSGHFASVDDAITAAWRAFLRQREQEQPEVKQPVGQTQGSIGAMRDAAAELDEVVEHAMNLRQRPWRVSAGE